MRIGLLYPARDPLSPRQWSGIPHGLAEGLSKCDVEVVPIGAGLPAGVHQAVAVLSRLGGQRGAVADRTAVRQTSRNWALARSLARAGRLDGLVAMGAEMYDLAGIRPPGIPLGTFDDATLQGMWRSANSDIRQSAFPEKVVHRWFGRQASSSRAASVCCVSTQWAARSFTEDYGVEPRRIHVVGMGHRPRHHIAAVERDWSVPRYLFVGIDWQRKNGDAVVRAFSEIRKSFPDAKLDLVGRHPRLGEPGVTGHGVLPRENAQAQERLDNLFARATVFVLPSRFEPAGIAYLEAASAGLPVIATTEGGAGEMLGNAAITVPPDDHDAIVDAMRRLADPAVSRSMGAAAARRAGESTWADVALRILQALQLRAPATSPS
jgi:glycosyltransferase involved in cell wall biosynthesis